MALLAVVLSGIALAEAQTWYYRRIKVVDERAGGVQTSRNDDAHYITFNPQSCYASDGNGMAVNSAQALRYVKRDNGIDIYWGTSIYGSDTYCYLDPLTGRVNMKCDGKVHVYERVANPAGCTAAARPASDPATPAVIIAPSPGNNGGGSDPTPAQRRYAGRRQCPGCDGSGRLPDQITYGPQYVSAPDKWCDKCGRYMPNHSHRRPMCRVCNGKGYVEN